MRSDLLLNTLLTAAQNPSPPSSEAGKEEAARKREPKIVELSADDPDVIVRFEGLQVRVSKDNETPQLGVISLGQYGVRAQ